mmetsp:Transcript_37070/g.62395  ORF Transcript_37070/g.62395 Transcript_37070/m.62395 type:complete len:269 (+) Transcript_37070:563-1369(+)
MTLLSVVMLASLRSASKVVFAAVTNLVKAASSGATTISLSAVPVTSFTYGSPSSVSTFTRMSCFVVPVATTAVVVKRVAPPNTQADPLGSSTVSTMWTKLLPASRSAVVMVAVWPDAVLRVTVGSRLATVKFFILNKVSTTKSTSRPPDRTAAPTTWYFSNSAMKSILSIASSIVPKLVERTQVAIAASVGANTVSAEVGSLRASNTDWVSGEPLRASIKSPRVRNRSSASAFKTLRMDSSAVAEDAPKATSINIIHIRTAIVKDVQE